MQPPFYAYDLQDPHQFLLDPWKFKPTIEQNPQWYERRFDEDYKRKLIYRFEKSIPQVVQDSLEHLGFTEWDPKLHEEDNWNIYWKN